jgi:RNA polymerase sigma-70 factor (ECF subfamily)
VPVTPKAARAPGTPAARPASHSSRRRTDVTRAFETGFLDVEITDAAVIQRVLDGDTDAFAIIVNRYHERYARVAHQMLGDRDDAEEAVQETFVRAYRSLRRYEDRERFGGWLLRILVNRCRTAGAKRSRRERTFLRLDERTPIDGDDRPAERREWREEIRRALARLEPDQREAFVLKHVEDLSYEEIAGITGAGVSALKMRVKRACERLREILEER